MSEDIIKAPDGPFELISPSNSIFTIGPTAPPDPLVVMNAQAEEIFRITKDGDIYSKGRLIKGDDEMLEVTKEFMRIMVENMSRTNR